MSIPRDALRTGTGQEGREQGPGPQERKAVAWHEAMGRGSQLTLDPTQIQSVWPARQLAVVKTTQALDQAGGDRLLTIVLVRDLEGKRPEQMFYCTKLDWTARQILGLCLPLGD